MISLFRPVSIEVFMYIYLPSVEASYKPISFKIQPLEEFVFTVSRQAKIKKSLQTSNLSAFTLSLWLNKTCLLSSGLIPFLPAQINII